MIIKLAALGALGYAGYRYLQKSDSQPAQRSTPPVTLAGGPLSSQATVQTDPDVPPPATA